MNKTLKVMTSAALLAGVVAPVAVTNVDAATDSRVGDLVTIADDAENTLISELIFQEDNDYETDLQPGKTFTLTFPQGAKIKNTTNDMIQIFNGSTSKWENLNAVTGGKVEIVGDYTVNVTIPHSSGSDLTNYVDGSVNKIKVAPKVTIDGLEGNQVNVAVESFGAGIKTGTYTLAKVEKGSTSSTVLSTATVGESGGKLGSIRLTENTNSAIGKGKVVLSLPNGFDWNTVGTGTTDTKVTLSGGFSGLVDGTDYKVTPADNKLTIEFLKDPNSSIRGIVQVEAQVSVDTDDAKYGDVNLSISGTDVASQEVSFGKYSDYDVTVEADGDAKELVAGRDYTDWDDQELQTLVIKEKVNKTFINRNTKIEFPKGVKVTGVEVKTKNASGFTADGVYKYDGSKFAGLSGITIDENEVEFTTPVDDSGKTEIELKFWVSVKADFTGDIVAKVSGRGGIEGEALLGKAIAPVQVEANIEELQIGVREQAIGDIYLSEIKAETLAKDEVKLTLADGIQWNDEPTIEVVEGDLDIDKDTISVNGSDLTFDVKSTSSKPSKIKISGAKVDIDRTVPEGPITVEVGGDAVVTNGSGKSGDQHLFDKANVGKFAVAKIVTPAPGKATAQEVKFAIGAASYTVDGVEKQMDVAPFVEAGRTYMPIRYVAEAVGVNTDSIFWDQSTQTATLIKGDRVVQLTAGSKSLKVNGASISMDAAAKVKDGRTVLPVRFVGQALGATVDYNEADKTVTVK